MPEYQHFNYRADSSFLQIGTRVVEAVVAQKRRRVVVFKNGHFSHLVQPGKAVSRPFRRYMPSPLRVIAVSQRRGAGVIVTRPGDDDWACRFSRARRIKSDG